MKYLRLLGSALAKFNRDQGFFLASGIAFQTLLCLVPFALLILSFAGSYLLTDERMIQYFGWSLEQAAPVLDPAMRDNLLEIIAHRGTSGIVGTVGLLWMAAAVFSGLRHALNAIFEVPTPRGTLRGFAFDIGMIVLSGASFLASVGLTGVIEYLRRVQSAVFPAAPGILLHLALSYVVPFVLAVVLCFQIFHLVPNRRVCTRSALMGALFTSVLWEVAKHLFTWYVSAFGRGFSLVYGSLSAAAFLLLWIYYSAAVLLMGAEVAVLLEKERAAEPPG